MPPVIIIGYSGHAYVVIDILQSQERAVAGYCDREEKKNNPFGLNYFGSEKESAFNDWTKENDWFVAIGHNQIRKAIFDSLAARGIKEATRAIHKSAIIGSQVELAAGVMIGANVSINALATVGQGTILNTSCVVEHECQIGAFAHIAPGAILTGNVKVGDKTFVGAGAVIKQGVIIGNNVTIGAGAVVLKDVPDDVVIIGNPGRLKD